ncbi:MAG TPA: hypothetical protein DDW52_24845, partial [Planctomycetaceae bacterium]|nr:hypothetical protein [Planctomycetaceae bacterium]
MDVPERESIEDELRILLLAIIMSQGSGYWQGAVPSPANIWNKLQSSKVPKLLDKLAVRTSNDTLKELRQDKMPSDLSARLPVISQGQIQELSQTIARKHEFWLRNRRLAKIERIRPPGLKNLYDEIARSRDAVDVVTKVISESQTLTTQFAGQFLGIKYRRIWRRDPRSNT